jgi:CheY-like chemotaxis protein
MSDRPRIVIADDDFSVSALLKRVLERDGFEAVVASNGLETLDRIGSRVAASPRCPHARARWPRDAAPDPRVRRRGPCP